MEERHVLPQMPASYNDDCLCATDPDLLLLRKNAAGERMAIYHYLCAAEKTNGALCRMFTEIAHDEMIHFRRGMALLAKYDPLQDCALNDACINLPPSDSFRRSKSCASIEVIQWLSESIVHELEDINQYQESYLCAQHKDVKIYFCETGNDEKTHVAKLWKAVMEYTKENTCAP